MCDCITETTLHYFFSAVFQGNMALLALLGVFVVFRLQYLQSTLQTKDRTIFDYVPIMKQKWWKWTNHTGDIPQDFPLYYRSVPGIARQLNEITKDVRCKDAGYDKVAEGMLTDGEFNAGIEERNKIITLTNESRRGFILPSFLILLVILISVFSLPNSKCIECTCCFKYSLVAYTICLQLITFVSISYFVFRCLRPVPERG